MWAHVHTYAHARIPTHLCTHVHMYNCTHVCTHTCTLTHTHSSHSYTNTYAQACTRAHTHALTHRTGDGVGLMKPAPRAGRRRCSHYETNKGPAKPLPSCSKDGLQGEEEAMHSPRGTQAHAHLQRQPGLHHACGTMPSQSPCSVPTAGTGVRPSGLSSTGCHRVGARPKLLRQLRRPGVSPLRLKPALPLP